MIKHIKLGHRKLIVEYVDGDYAEGNMGTAVPKTNKIFLNKDIPEDNTLETLLHEILHHLVDYFHIRIKEEENVINPLACGIATILLDNPQFAKLFVKEGE